MMVSVPVLALGTLFATFIVAGGGLDEESSYSLTNTLRLANVWGPR